MDKTIISKFVLYFIEIVNTCHFSEYPVRIPAER